jgi:hypothetical protein
MVYLADQSNTAVETGKSLVVAGGAFDNDICAHIHLLRTFDCVSSHARIFATISS